VEGGIALDEDVFADKFLEFREPRGVVLLEDLYGFGVDAEEDVGAFEELLHLAQLGVDLVAHGGWALDHAGGLAGGAGD